MLGLEALDQGDGLAKHCLVALANAFDIVVDTQLLAALAVLDIWAHDGWLLNAGVDLQAGVLGVVLGVEHLFQFIV